MKKTQVAPEWWAKVVATVIHDHQLSMGARVTFCELALWTKRGNGVVSRGQRAIAKGIDVHQQTALGYLRELADRGHIEVGGTGRSRRWYVLKSAAYWEKGKPAVAAEERKSA